MKKIVALLLLFSSPVYALSDCADKPTCEEIGYTHNEYACDQKIAMPCPFDSSKIYCPGPICEPGYFLYSDGSCSLALKSDKTVIGIVFDKEWRLAVSVEPSVNLKFGNNPDNLDLNNYETVIVPDLGWGPNNATRTCVTDCNGRENTKKIIDYAKANNYVFPAAEYCYNFAASGKGKGNWWLPSYVEMVKVYNQIALIDAALETAGKQATTKSSHWLSQQWTNTNSEGVQYMAGRYLNLSHGGDSHWRSNNGLPVICITRY